MFKAPTLTENTEEYQAFIAQGMKYIDKLPPEQRYIIQQYHVYYIPFHIIAINMGKTEAIVRRLYMKAWSPLINQAFPTKAGPKLPEPPKAG